MSSYLKTLSATTTGTPNRCAISICFLRLLWQPPVTRLRFCSERRRRRRRERKKKTLGAGNRTRCLSRVPSAAGPRPVAVTTGCQRS